MSERCELSDLPVDQCACRVHAAPEPGRLQPIVIQARFFAHFDSDCDECGNRMMEGEPIARTEDGEYVCLGCAS